MKSTSLLALIIMCSVSLQLHSQQLAVRMYDQSSGLLSNGVNVVYQDSRGYVWIGTNEGVSIYDGREFVSYTPVDGLALNYVNCMVESRKNPGTMWIGTHGGGISKVRLTPGIVNPEFTTIQLDTILAAKRVRSIVEAGDGTIWCLTGAGIYLIRGDTVVPSTPRYRESRTITSGPDGSVWIVDGNILYRYDPETSGTRQVLTLRHGTRAIHAVYADDSGQLWLSTTDSLLLCIRDSVTVGMRRITAGLIEQILADKTGDLWLLTRNGILKLPADGFTTATWVRYSSKNGFRSSVFRSGLFDHEQNLWVTSGFGVEKWTMRNLSAFPMQAGHVYNNGAVAADSKGHLWAASKDGLSELWLSSTGEWITRHHQLPPDLTHREVQGVRYDAKGRLWIDTPADGIRCYRIERTREGLSRLIDSTPKGLAEILPKGRQCFIVDRNDRLWVSVHGIGVVVIDAGGRARLLRTFTDIEGLDDWRSVRAIFEDRDGRVWFAGFNGGVAYVDDPLQPPSILDKKDLPEGGVRAISQDKFGRMWLGTRYGGLVLLDKDGNTVLTMHQGLMSNAIWSLGHDGDTTLWIGTASGLQSLNLITLALSTMPAEFRGTAVYACGVSAGRLLWMGSNSALKVFNIAAARSVKGVPLIHIARFEVNGVSLPVERSYEFDHDQSTCTFEFNGVSFVDEEAVRYQYRLDPVDEIWHGPTDEHAVTYASLAPGAYRLEVRALNAEGVVSAVPAAVEFTIAPPYWQTWWFRALLLAAVVLIAGSVIRHRFSRLQNEARVQQEFSRKLLELQEAERKRIAAGLHDSLGQNLLVLRNALQHRTTKNDHTSLSDLAQEAIDEVREVSFDLHPHVLDRLGLRKAIETVVDKMMRGTAMSISTAFDGVPATLGSQIDIGIYRITQEALSNIVKHAHAKTAGVRLSKINESLRLQISDDGGGFDAREFLTRPPERWSLGLLNIAERVRLLGGTYSITSAPGRGTTVTVEVPLVQG